ncbi:MAG: H-X9-DG-CTERM domain-containing protein [Armatimonadota bacterium]
MALVDARHNDGAVFSYADGHVAFIAKTSLNALIFLPCVNPANFTTPVALGPLFSKPVQYTNGTARFQDGRTLLNNAGITTLVGAGCWGNNYFCFNDGTLADQHDIVDSNGVLTTNGAGYIKSMTKHKFPTNSTGDPVLKWWKLGIGNTYVQNAYAVTTLGWGDASFGVYSPCGFCDQSNTKTLTIVPDVNTDMVKKMAMTAQNTNVDNCNFTARINWIKIYDENGLNPVQTTFTANNTASIKVGDGAYRMTATGFVLPVHPDCNIEINYTTTSTANGGMNLAFEP